MKVLITGGAGFIGSHVQKQLLDRGHEVVVYDNLSRGFKQLIDPRAQFIQGNILEKEKLVMGLKDVEAVIHMAAYIIVPESVEKPEMYQKNNVGGTKVLLEAMNEAGVKKIIFSSTATVYGKPDKLPLDENSPVKQAENPYGQTKIEMEKLIENQHKQNGLSAILLRYFNPFGPNELHDPETHAIPNFIKSVLNDRPIPLYWKGEQERDFIYVEDLAVAHIDTLALNGFHVFNVGTGKGTRVKEILETIFKLTGKEVDIEDLGERAGDVESLYTSAEKISLETGWEPKISLEEGLRRTIDFFKKS